MIEQAGRVLGALLPGEEGETVAFDSYLHYLCFLAEPMHQFGPGQTAG